MLMYVRICYEIIDNCIWDVFVVVLEYFFEKHLGNSSTIIKFKYKIFLKNFKTPTWCIKTGRKVAQVLF